MQSEVFTYTSSPSGYNATKGNSVTQFILEDERKRIADQLRRDSSAGQRLVEAEIRQGHHIRAGYIAAMAGMTLEQSIALISKVSDER